MPLLFITVDSTGGGDLRVDGVDYINTSVVVTFAAANNFSSFATISIKNDRVFEEPEQFHATFELPPGYKNLSKGIPSQATVTIHESRSKCALVNHRATKYHAGVCIMFRLIIINIMSRNGCHGSALFGCWIYRLDEGIFARPEFVLQQSEFIFY